MDNLANKKRELPNLLENLNTVSSCRSFSSAADNNDTPKVF
ncbi:MAG: hypothetical protein ABJB76_02175 [Candidatus Nitrosocosmicus sp.]